MDRYDNLDLECDEEVGTVSQKTALFGGMFKKTNKSAEPSTKAQDSLSTNGELSKSNDSLTDNHHGKDKGGVFKGMFKKTAKSSKEGDPQVAISSESLEFSGSSENLTEKSSKDKSGAVGWIISPRPGHVRRPSQDLLELSASNDSLNDKTSINKESGGMFSGIFKRSPKPRRAGEPSQEDLSAQSELSESTDSLSNTKESGGMLSGMFKKASKPFGARAKSQEDLSAANGPSGSTDNLSEGHTKEKGGILSGMFRKKGAKYQSQDDLSVDDEISASNDSLSEKPSKSGVAAKILKNPFTSSSQETVKTESSGDSNANSSAAQTPKAKQNGLNAMMKSTFYTDKEEKSSSTDEDTLENGDNQPSHKQSKLAGAMTKLNPFRAANKYEKQAGSDDEESAVTSEKLPSNKPNSMVEAMSKLNPFRSANKKGTENTDMTKEKEKPDEVKSNLIQPERTTRSETPPVRPKPAQEKMKAASTNDKVKPRRTEESQSDDESAKEGESAGRTDGNENHPENKKTKEKKTKRHNPFMPRAAIEAASDDEGLKDDDDVASREEKKEEGKDEAKETKVKKKPKRLNPFMPQVKAKVVQRQAQDGAGGSEENDRSLFDRLEDFRLGPSRPGNSQDFEDLMNWWKNVEAWEDTPQDDDMTEKEEAKAFALTAEKVQKGIRVFNKLFSERAESLWQHVIDLNAIADGLDKFNKNTKIAQITGGSTSAIGGVATIAGLALAPVTMGTSLIITAVGLGVATAGGLTSAGAGISNQVNNSMDRKKVEKIVEDYQEKMLDLNKCLTFIKQGIENLRKFDLIKMKKNAYNQDFPALTSSFYEDGAMVGKAILINANEIMRVVQIANVAGSTAARAVQIASMATGVLTGLFVGMDIYFVAKDSKELKKGAKSEFAAKIREVATQLHDGLVELNGIREELQSTTSENKNEEDSKALDNEKKEKSDKYDSSDEDEIDRIKKAIKKDIENRDYETQDWKTS
ncbi:apolipoprotein L1 isoform X2 [Cololabis saira]|uniref:apolipoprotein L1 isoform X2 n=1 Tax=Cololabis saira TaxID=129043 RepID=UPI002AD4B686|nr:apolipoprotein L1 isoform X2 [Cololabis saira]